MVAIQLPSLLLLFSVSALVASHKSTSDKVPESVNIFALAYPIVAYVLESVSFYFHSIPRGKRKVIHMKLS